MQERIDWVEQRIAQLEQEIGEREVELADLEQELEVLCLEPLEEEDEEFEYND